MFATFRYVGDFLYVLNRPPTSQTYHRYIWSVTENGPKNSWLITLLLYLADWLYYLSLTRVGIFMIIEIFLESLNELLISENGWTQYKISNPFFHQWDVWIQN